MSIEPSSTPKEGVFAHLYEDAMAGVITGLMAVPLSAGICIMSEYPIYIGLYTVILAGVISFIASLFRVGNYTGMPGVAAGLAPALALGIHSFGMDNMPFVIFMTASIQALVWYKGWEKYILKMVPHYLVEGLLAGVGLKIGSKFLPDILMHSAFEWAIVITGGIGFVWLFKRFRHKSPAIPYVLLMVFGFAADTVVEFPKLVIEEAPFVLALPLPHIDGNGVDVALTLLQMFAFALMLASIDVIEQVMSNVGIEEIDPLKRPTNSNNSLMAIWIGNMAATFFGGMTNLDGLAKSTTNTIAGARTKLSNVFTSLVLFGVVMFPEVMTSTPMFVLAIIMIFSGWKMVAKIGHTHHYGRYPFLLSVICMILVYSFGIFEGLVIVLGTHAIIMILEEREHGLSLSQIWEAFRGHLNGECVLLSEGDAPEVKAK